MGDKCKLAVRWIISTLRVCLQGALAVAVAWVLLMPLSVVAYYCSANLYFGWTLTHGGIVVAFPPLVIASYALVGLLPGLRRIADPHWRFLAVGFGLSIAQLLPDAASTTARDLVYLATFVVMIVLSTVAYRPYMMGVLVVLPVGLNGFLSVDGKIGVSVAAATGYCVARFARWVGSRRTDERAE